MSSNTYEGRKKTKNGVKRLVFSALAILLQLIFFMVVFTKLNRYAEAIDIITRLFALVLVLRIYGQHMTSSMKTPWIILITVFPILGVALYLLVGLNGSTKVMRERYRKIDEKLSPFLVKNPAVLSDLKEKLPKAGSIASYIENNADYPLYRNTDVTYYDYAEKGLEAQLALGVSYRTFFDEAPDMNPAWERVTGSICGVRIEGIDHPLMRKIRVLDKLVDELAKGKPMDRVLRKE